MRIWTTPTRDDRSRFNLAAILAETVISGYNPGMSKPQRFSKQLRAALKECGQTRYAVSKATGISQPTLSRFADGSRGLPLKTIDQLVEYLGLELVARRKASKKG